MGWRDKAERLKEAATASVDQVRSSEKLAELKDAAQAGADRARNSDAFNGLDAARLKEAAVTSAGLANRRGEVKRSRVARAALAPAATASKVARGVGAEIARQKRSPAGAAEGEVNEADVVSNAADLEQNGSA